MKSLIGLLFLIHSCTSIYDTALASNITQLELRIGEFKNVSLPFDFQTYYSIDIGKPEAEGGLNVPYDVCTVEERQFSLFEVDYLPLNWTNFLYTDVVTQYTDLLTKKILIDMAVDNNLLYVVQSDAIKVFARNLTSNGRIGEMQKIFQMTEPLEGGKLIKGANSTLYLVSQNNVYRITQEQVLKLEGYTPTQEFQSAVTVGQKTLLVAAGKSGIHVYNIIEGDKLNRTTILNSTFFTLSVDISDIQANGTFVYLLDRQSSIIKLSVNPTSGSISKENVYKIDRTGCQTMQLFGDDIYIACPELHRISFYSEGVVDKPYEHPNFNPRSIVFFQSTIILVGHNLAKIYHEGVQMGYYHDFTMRKLVPIGDKILIGSNYGVSLTSWDMTQPAITCGLKRRGMTESYAGKVNTTIDVVAECNKRYFEQYKIQFKQGLRNEACLYHFPLSINFWIGKQINYLPLKISVGVIGLVLVVAMIGWCTLNTRVKNLSSAIKRFTILSKTTSSVPYEKMVEQPPSEDGKRDSTQTHSNQFQLHQIGD